MDNPYDLADKAIKLLNRKAAARYEEAWSRMQIAGFDEANVLSACKRLYTGLTRDNRQAFTELCGLAYRKAAPKGKKEPDWPLIFLWLEEYDPVTRYVYTHETARKQAYAQEAVIAAKTRGAKEEELRRGLKYWAAMTGQYCDILTDKSSLKAYRDAGVKYVMWVTEKDERVCPVCRPLDGRVYPIEKAPEKQHWHCRCWLVPVTKRGKIIS